MGADTMGVMDELASFKAELPQFGALIGLDPGTKTLGIAVSDVTRRIATPLTTLKRTKFTKDAETLFKLTAEREPVGLVIGLPVQMDGTEGSRARSCRSLAANLSGLKPAWPILLWDERLSTAAVQRMMTDEADLSRKRRAEAVDRAAAAFILQGVLDALDLAR